MSPPSSTIVGLEPTTAEARIDRFEDTASSIAEPVLAAKDVYETNSAAIQAAVAAIATCGGAGRALDDWFSVADKVVDGLDGLAKSSAFPFVGVAVLLFKGVIRLETQRRENSKRSRALILQMADMMGALLQLGDVNDPDLKDPRTGQSIAGRIQGLMKNIENDIRDCGNLIDTYSKHSFASKFFFSGQYVEKFKMCADGLVSRKGEIVFALQIHSTIGIDEIQAEVKNSNAMLAKLVSIIDHSSSRKADLSSTMHDLGGRNKVLSDDDLLTTMAIAIQARQSKKSTTTSSTQESADLTSKEDTTLTHSERLELRLPLVSILERNAAFYSQKLDAQITRIVSQLDKLQASSAVILKTITGGAWERVRHPDLRNIWKDNAWRTSVEARKFVLAIHDYYTDLFAQGVTSKANGEPLFTPASNADEWCLQYLNVRHVSSLMEAFDADGSGFVRVAEANAFCESIPSGLNLLQWLAYWSAGWKQEVAIYSHRIIQLLKRMRVAFGDVVLQNSRIIQRYFQTGQWQRNLDMLIFAAASKFRPSSKTPLDKLVQSEMKRKEAVRQRLLENLSYNVDAPESLPLVYTSPRLEADFLPLVYQLLRYHYALFEFSKTKVIDERELIQANNALTQVMREVKFRIDGLEDAWTELGADVSMRFSRYAGGLYEYLHAGHGNGNPEEVCDEDFADDVEMDIEHIVGNMSHIHMRFGEWHPNTSGYEHPPTQDNLDGTVIEAETPVAPFAIEPHSDLGLPAEAYIRRVVLRLESLTLDKRFAFIEQSAQLLRTIALDEHESRPARLPRILTIQMANMLHTILQIRFVENLMLVSDTGDTPLSRVEALMRRIKEDLKDCGHLIHAFRRRTVHGSPHPHSDINVKFKERAEGLERRTQDILRALALPSLKGKNRFRAIVRTVVAQIADARHRRAWAFLKQRRDIRTRYVSLVTKQLQPSEFQTTWNTRVPLTSTEAEELERISRQLLPGDLEYYQSLAQQMHRSTWVHADKKCNCCGEMPIRGVRYLCTVCHNFDLCAKCEEKWATEEHELPSDGHHSGHPLLKVSRPIIKLERYVLEDLAYIHCRHVDDSDSEDSSSLEEFGDEEDLDRSRTPSTGPLTPPTMSATPFPATDGLNSVRSKNSPFYKPWSFSEVEGLPQNNRPWDSSFTGIEEVEEAESLVGNGPEHRSSRSALGLHIGDRNGTSAGRGGLTWEALLSATDKLEMPIVPGCAGSEYRCAHCHEIKAGTRLIMAQRYRGTQLCPSCDAALEARYLNAVLPDYLRLLLKYKPPLATFTRIAPSKM